MNPLTKYYIHQAGGGGGGVVSDQSIQFHPLYSEDTGSVIFLAVF
jgi:hypothetical protein